MDKQIKVANQGAQVVKPLSQKKTAGKSKVIKGGDLRTGGGK